MKVWIRIDFCYRLEQETRGLLEWLFQCKCRPPILSSIIRPRSQCKSLRWLPCLLDLPPHLLLRVILHSNFAFIISNCPQILIVDYLYTRLSLSTGTPMFSQNLVIMVLFSELGGLPVTTCTTPITVMIQHQQTPPAPSAQPITQHRPMLIAPSISTAIQAGDENEAKSAAAQANKVVHSFNFNLYLINDWGK